MKKNTLVESPLCCGVLLRRMLDNISGKRVTVVGLGLFGGGEGAARFFSALGASVTVLDLKSKEQLSPAVARLSDLPIKFRFGAHNQADIDSSDLVVLNPAVPRDCDIVDRALNRDIPLTSPMNVFLCLCPAPVAAVTGSVGKSTTTSMLAGMLAVGGRKVHIGGNIGISLLDNLDSISADDLVVLELSCFQLEDASSLPFSPHTSVVTNILPNHLDRYDSFESYAEAKKNIIKYQGKDSLSVLNGADPTLRDWMSEVKGDMLSFNIAEVERSDGEDTPGFGDVWLEEGKIMSRLNGRKEPLFSANDLNIPGAHNIKNAAAAAAAARWLGAGTSDIRHALKGFCPLEHRLEHCGSACGMTFYNDSDSTTPESTIAAINSFRPPITLICGGKDKGLPYEKLAEVIAARVNVLITLGQCGPHVAKKTREAGGENDSMPIVEEASSLSNAVMKSCKHSVPGSTVLFSPAYASFDMFQNFAERGNRFKEIVQSLNGKKSAQQNQAEKGSVT